MNKDIKDSYKAIKVRPDRQCFVIPDPVKALYAFIVFFLFVSSGDPPRAGRRFQLAVSDRPWGEKNIAPSAPPSVAKIIPPKKWNRNPRT